MNFKIEKTDLFKMAGICQKKTLLSEDGECSYKNGIVYRKYIIYSLQQLFQLRPYDRPDC